LLKIAGKPLIVWVAERARAASTISRTIVATDDPRIVDAVNAAGFDAVITRADHATGTDRIAEVAHNLRADIIVNVQGDEPLIDPQTIDRAVNALIEDRDAQMSTTWESITEEADATNPSVVKVTLTRMATRQIFRAIRSRIRLPRKTARMKAVPKDRGCFLILRSTPACTRIDGIFCLPSRVGHSQKTSARNHSNNCGRLIAV